MNDRSSLPLPLLWGAQLEGRAPWPPPLTRPLAEGTPGCPVASKQQRASRWQQAASRNTQTLARMWGTAYRILSSSMFWTAWSRYRTWRMTSRSKSWREFRLTSRAIPSVVRSPTSSVTPWPSTPVLCVSSERPGEPHVLESAPSPISLATVSLVALFFPLFNCVTLLRRRKPQESAPQLDSWLPEPHATPGSFSTGPYRCLWCPSNPKAYLFSEVLPEIVINQARLQADNFCKAEVSPNPRELRNGS